MGLSSSQSRSKRITTRKVVLRVFLAHTETGSTGNLARELGSGDFWLNSNPVEQDEPLALMDQKLAATPFLGKVVLPHFVVISG